MRILVKLFAILFVLGFSFESTGQFSTYDRDSIYEFSSCFNFPESISCSKLEMFPVGKATIMHEFGLDRKGEYFELSCKFNGVPLDLISWYRVEDSIYVAKNSFLLLDNLFNSTYSSLDSFKIIDEFSEKVSGIDKVKFITEYSGRYHDEMYKTDNIKFEFRYVLMENSRMNPRLYDTFKSRYDYESLNVLIDSIESGNPLGIKLVFYSVPVGNMERLNQTRLIFFDTGQVIGASEIRSAWYM